MPTRRNLGEMFSLLRRTSPSRPAYTTDQIREIMAGSRITAPARPVRRLPAVRTLLLVAMMGIISGALAPWFAGRSASPNAMREPLGRAGTAPEAGLLKSPASSGDTTAGTTAEGATRKKDSTEKDSPIPAKHSPGPESITIAPATAPVAAPGSVYRSGKPARDPAGTTTRLRIPSGKKNMPQYIPATGTIDGLKLMVEEEYAFTNLHMDPRVTVIADDTTGRHRADSSLPLDTALQ